MNMALRIITALPGILFLSIAARFMFDPAGAAAQLGMPLLEGIGRSTQLGDLSGFFLTAGSMILLGVITQHRTWFYAVALLIGSTAVFRILAWLLHDAALATESIAVEVVVTVLVLVTARACAKAAD